MDSAATRRRMTRARWMSSASYWERRKAQEMFRYMAKAEDTADEIAKLYQKSSGYLSAELDKIFDRYKRKHHLTDAEAYRLLNSIQDKTSIDELKEALRAGGDAERGILAELEGPAYQARMERLQQLQNQLDLTMNNIYQQEKVKNTSHYVDLANEAYYRSIFDVQQRTGLGFSFNLIGPKVIDKVINSKWSGANYSTRIWHNTHALAQDLKEELLVNLVTGRTDREVAEIIANKFAQGASTARRLVRTESCNLANQMEMQSYEECGIETYIYVATLDLKTSTVCRELDGKRFPVSEQHPGKNCPPMHPWCRSTTICNITDEELAQMQRRARNPVTGKNETVPANMTYEQWYTKNVKGRPEAEANEKMIRNRSEDRRQYEKYKRILGDDVPKTFDKFQNLKYNDVNGFNFLKQKVISQQKTEGFLEKLNSGNININIKRVKQQEHIRGTKKWKERVKENLVSKGTAPDMFSPDMDIQALMNKSAGTGTMEYRKGQKYPIEYVTADHVIGKSFNLGTGKYEDTKRFAIRYSAKGVHLHPVKEV